MGRVFSSLLLFLFAPFMGHGPVNNHEVEERFIPAVSQCLDDYFSKYEENFSVEKNFWINTFLLDSSKAFVYKRDSMEIIDTLPAPYDNSKDRAILDSVHKANDFIYNPKNKKTKKFGIIYGRKQRMERAVERAFNHLDYIIDSLEYHGLPTSLAVLPFFESEFREDANSWARAKGIWQFRKGTARDYGLRVDRHADERKDPKKSLSAFIRYMEKANDRFDSNLLALVSYNTGLYSPYFHGRDSIADIDLVKKMGFAPRHYFASFLASKEILKDPLKFFPDAKIKKY